jgi:hypothetical protein
MASNRERFADMLYDSVSFGEPKSKKSEEEAAIYKRTASGRRVSHEIGKLSDSIRANTTDSVGGILAKWRARIVEQHESAVETGKWPPGGTVMQNATIVKYNAGRDVFGITTSRKLGGDERVWLVYTALGGAHITEPYPSGTSPKTAFETLRAATSGHHTTGKYKQPPPKEQARLLELLARVMTKALQLESMNVLLSGKAEKRVREILEEYRNRALTPRADPRETPTTQNLTEESSGAPRSVAPPPTKRGTKERNAKEVAKAKSAAVASKSTTKSPVSTPQTTAKKSRVAKQAKPRIPKTAKTTEQIAQEEALAKENEKKQAIADAKEKEDAEKAKRRNEGQKKWQAKQTQAEKKTRAWTAQQKKAAAQRIQTEKMR